MNKFAITGATGFVGRFLVHHLMSLGESPVVITRNAADLTELLQGCETVVHLAARVHVKREININSLDEFRAANVAGTLRLAEISASSGVKRFVFISTIGVNGYETFDRPFREDDPVFPHSPYAISKYEAELGLQEVSNRTGIEVVIIRSPLVYGPNAPGNFGGLIRLLHSGLPLPFGNIQNKRSFVALENLVDFILVCCINPLAANQTFLISDGEDLSTTELLTRMGKALDKPVRLVSVPTQLLKRVAHIFGKDHVAKSLLGSLQVDIGKARSLLGWVPMLTVDEGLQRLAGKRY